MTIRRQIFSQRNEGWNQENGENAGKKLRDIPRSDVRNEDLQSLRRSNTQIPGGNNRLRVAGQNRSASPVCPPSLAPEAGTILRTRPGDRRRSDRRRCSSSGRGRGITSSGRRVRRGKEATSENIHPPYVPSILPRHRPLQPTTINYPKPLIYSAYDKSTPKNPA